LFESETCWEARPTRRITPWRALNRVVQDDARRWLRGFAWQLLLNSCRRRCYHRGTKLPCPDCIAPGRCLAGHANRGVPLEIDRVPKAGPPFHSPMQGAIPAGRDV